MRGVIDSKERADDALLFLTPPRDYETWKDIGISYKAAGGDVDTFLRWSASDPEKYDEKVARQLFENVSADGRITAGTLFWHARRAGWTGEDPDGNNTAIPTPEPSPAREPTPVEQAVTQLEALFKPGEYVNLTVHAKWSEKRGKWGPADAGTCYERDDLIARLQEENFGAHSTVTSLKRGYGSARIQPTGLEGAKTRPRHGGMLSSRATRFPLKTRFASCVSSTCPSPR